MGRSLSTAFKPSTLKLYQQQNVPSAITCSRIIASYIYGKQLNPCPHTTCIGVPNNGLFWICLICCQKAIEATSYHSRTSIKSVCPCVYAQKTTWRRDGSEGSHYHHHTTLRQVNKRRDASILRFPFSSHSTCTRRGN